MLSSDFNKYIYILTMYVQFKRFYQQVVGNYLPVAPKG